ncbi:MAG: alpha/beta fold hydrolase [Gemmatimonadaceae bacterium]
MATGIRDARFVSLGGMDQWVTIRGDDVRRPILLLLHGRPGDVQSPFVSVYAPYERDFVLVQWDQRGAGKTLAKYGERTPELTLDRVTKIGIELAEYLHERFKANPLIVLGHSWGSVIGTEMIRARPDLFAAYVGIGQVASWAETGNAQCEFLKSKARETGNAALIAQLDSIGRLDQSNATQYFDATRSLRNYLGDADKGWFTRLRAKATDSLGMTDDDRTAVIGGMTLSGRTLLPTQMKEGLSTNALMLVMLAGTIPRNILFAANLRWGVDTPWAVPVTALYLWFFWRYVSGKIGPASTSIERRTNLRANRISGRAWVWALAAGVLGIVVLVIALRIVNRMVVLPEQTLPDLSHIPRLTVLTLLLAAVPVAGIVEEVGFHGYMQVPLERRLGVVVAILISGTMFAISHLDFTPVLRAYYVAVAAINGSITYLTDSVLPSIVLHTAGNVYSNLDLWLTGHAEWQASSTPRETVGKTGGDASLWLTVGAMLIVTAAAIGAFVGLVRTRIPVIITPEVAA